jgi:hypothetical protein
MSENAHKRKAPYTSSAGLHVKRVSFGKDIASSLRQVIPLPGDILDAFRYLYDSPSTVSEFPEVISPGISDPIEPD